MKLYIRFKPISVEAPLQGETVGIVHDVCSLLDSDTEAVSAYECRRCESEFDLQYHVCPDCGSYQVERTTWQFDHQ